MVRKNYNKKYKKDIKNVKETKNYNENEVVEMKKVENVVVNEIKNNNERGNEVMNNFDIGNVIEVVLKAIEETRDNPNRLSWKLDFIYEDTTLTDEEQAYCKKVLNLIEVSNSTDYIEKLFAAEDLDIFNVESENSIIFSHSENSHIRALFNEKWELEKEIKRDYAIYKLPIIKELLDGFMEWYKTEIEYSDILSNLMDYLECGDRIDLYTVIADNVVNNLHYINLGQFANYDNDSEVSDIWENAVQLIHSDYIEEHYPDIIDAFREEFIREYR